MPITYENYFIKDLNCDLNLELNKPCLWLRSLYNVLYIFQLFVRFYELQNFCYHYKKNNECHQVIISNFRAPCTNLLNNAASDTVLNQNVAQWFRVLHGSFKLNNNASVQ